MNRRIVLSTLAALAFAVPSASAQVTVLENFVLIDGTGAPPVTGARLVIEGERISAVGHAETVSVPAGAERIDLNGRTVMPGLVDSHFHIENEPRLALRQLANGVTAFRDPGAWMEKFDALKTMIAADGLEGPAMSLCGPHIDGEHPAYPKDSVVARDPEEARFYAERNIREGATAIKIYFRLPMASARAVIEVCKSHGVPCTAHLEILDAREALRAGLDGVEHITSFGSCLVSEHRAEEYRQSVLSENDARDAGRYQILSEADFESPGAKELFDIVREKHPFVDPTLAVFEIRASQPPRKAKRAEVALAVKGFENMKHLTLLMHQSGARIVLGGHTAVPFAGRGEAPFRELELLVESGLTPLEAIRAATLNGAQFLSRDRDFGSLEVGKRADLITVDGNPAATISEIRRVDRVMLGGRWIDVAKYRAY